MKRVQITRNHAVKNSLLYFSFFFSDNEDKNLKHLSAAEGMKYMNIGNAITEIRKTQGLTQEEFGALFHVTRQTVSNWENEKNYPDLQILVNISDQFNVSLDQLLKSDQQMILQIDKERSLGKLRRKKENHRFPKRCRNRPYPWLPILAGYLAKGSDNHHCCHHDHYRILV